ncbi:MAG: hypothetical protein MUC50_02475 [Myxococcota bacterium]|jgi:hypothetical protein|nr:hypothetical protein [Myxococcota bacterium]
MPVSQSTIYALGFICLSVTAWSALSGCTDGSSSPGDTADTADTGDTDTTSDSADCFDADTSPSGLGESCTKDGDECNGEEASRCLINVGNPDLSFCTVPDCTTGSCPCEMLCCDCMSQYPSWGVFCALQADVDAAIGGFCTCL